jgi:ATP-dependent RNA circularization protein (DNA/RNA ligase family)
MGDYAQPEFASVGWWRVSEKVDGTNIRVIIRDPGCGKDVLFAGRTNDAQIPPHLLRTLEELFPPDKLLGVFKGNKESRIILYGEGYGHKIQACGGKYRKEAGFILFDVRVGEWWLQQEDVKGVAESLGVPMVPDLGFMSESQIVEFVTQDPPSQCSTESQTMEGIVARSEPLMLFRNGNPIMWKLKCKDFA